MSRIRPGGCGSATGLVVPVGIVVPLLVALLDLLERSRRLGLGRVGPQPVGVGATLGSLDRVMVQAVPELSHSAQTTLACVTPVVPGTVSPRRPVPADIRRPEYVDKPTPARFTGSEVKDPETIERM